MERIDRAIARSSRKWTIIGVMLAFIFGAITVYGLFLQNKSGAFAETSIDVKIGGKTLYQDEENTIYYGIPYDKERNCITLAKLPIMFINKGEKTVQDFYIEVSYPTVLAPDPSLVTSEMSLFPKEGKQQRVIKEKYSLTMMNISSTDPGMTGEVEEILMLHPTQYLADVTTKDNQKVQLNVSVPYSFYLQISLRGKDMIPMSYPVKVYVLEAKTIDELQAKHLGIHRSKPQNNGIVSLIKNKLSWGKDNSDIMIFPSKTSQFDFSENRRVYVVDKVSIGIATPK